MSLTKKTIEFIRHSEDGQMTQVVIELAAKHPAVLNELVEIVIALAKEERGPQAADRPLFPDSEDVDVRVYGGVYVLNPYQQRDLIEAQGKIEAIKVFRNATGAGLKDAKDAIEFLAEANFIPSRFANSGGLMASQPHNHRHVSVHRSNRY